MLDTDSVASIVKNELEKPGLSAFLNGAKVIVHCLRNYRNWKAHTDELCPVSFAALFESKCLAHGFAILSRLGFHHSYKQNTKHGTIKAGGLLLDKTANHFFLFCQRKGQWEGSRAD